MERNKFQTPKNQQPDSKKQWPICAGWSGPAQNGEQPQLRD